ncbi:MAG: hypothetical protein R3B71_05975 [Candidatus Gracilibacteria bacterium]
MAKHPVPKYKTPKSKTRARYASFKRKKLEKLQGLIDGRMHTYKKAESLTDETKKNKEIEKITKVKA